MYYSMVRVGFLMLVVSIVIFVVSDKTSYFEGEKRFQNWLYRNSVLLVDIGSLLVVAGIIVLSLGCVGITWWSK